MKTADYSAASASASSFGLASPAKSDQFSHHPGADWSSAASSSAPGSASKAGKVGAAGGGGGGLFGMPDARGDPNAAKRNIVSWLCTVTVRDHIYVFFPLSFIECSLG